MTTEPFHLDFSLFCLFLGFREILQGDDFLPTEANAEASQLTKEKKCRFCLINAKRKNTSKSEAKILTVQEFQEENPLEIARNYAEFTGKVFDEEMEEMFKEIMGKVADDSRKVE